MIQFARALGLEVSLASYSTLEDLLLKARGGSGGYLVASRYPAGGSPFPSVAGSSMGDSVASRSVFSLPTLTETDGTDVIVGGAVVLLCKNHVRVDRPMLVWLWELKVVKDRELAVSKL